MGSKKQKQTQTYRPADYVEGGARRAMRLAQGISGQRYTPYTGERVAGLSSNERMGMDLARTSAGSHMPYYNEGAALIRRGAQNFTDADMSAYMNPYIKGALDPAAREIGERMARESNQIGSRMSAMSAFGGSRAALMDAETKERGYQQIGDLYGRGYAEAWREGARLWGADKAREMAAGGQLMTLGNAVASANRADINSLMATGATDRTIRQAMADFDYGQFVENRDWDIRNLNAMLTALNGVKGSTTTTQTSVTEQEGDPLGQVLGLAATVMGAMYNPAGAAAGGLSALSGAGAGAWNALPEFGQPSDVRGMLDFANQSGWTPQGGSVSTYPYGTNPVGS